MNGEWKTGVQAAGLLSSVNGFLGKVAQALAVEKFSIEINQTGSPMDSPLFMRLKFAEMPAELKVESSDSLNFKLRKTFKKLKG